MWTATASCVVVVWRRLVVVVVCVVSSSPWCRRRHGEVLVIELCASHWNVYVPGASAMSHTAEPVPLIDVFVEASCRTCSALEPAQRSKLWIVA